MNGIEKILDKLQEESRAEADVILAKAKEDAAAITAQFARQAEQEKTAAEEKGLRTAEERQGHLIRVAEMESKKAILATKQKVLDKAFAQARMRLMQMPKERYITLLATLAASNAASGAEAVVLNERDRSTCGEKVVAEANRLREKAGRPAALTLSPETADMDGGLLLRDTVSEVNCTFDTLLRLSREEVAAQAAVILFD